MSHAKELEFAKALALEAGGVMRRYFRAEDISTSWKHDNSPLTIADTTINKMVIDQVKTNFPDHGVLGEEESYKDERETIWVLDPIDGTIPFSLGIPLSTFSLALVSRKDGQPYVAVTYDPWLDEMFWATRGGGAFFNDKPIKTTTAESLKQGYLFLSLRDIKTAGIDYRAGPAIKKLRAGGAKLFSIQSGVYCCNRIAAGQFLGGIFGSPRAWDSAAAALIVKEAGGIVSDMKGESRRYDEDGLGCVMAANQTIHDQLMEVIHENSGD